MSYVRIERPRSHTRVLVLDRPERMNALSFDTVGPLHDAIAEVGADNEARVVILTGAGRGFCSGLDLEDHGAPPNIDGLPMSRIAIRAMEHFASLVPELRRLPQPVIGAIHGPAVGGGLCLALGADIRLAARSAVFRAAGINNGLTATELGASWILPRVVGFSRAAEIMLSGRDVGAEEAERIGLVSRVVPEETLLDACLELADRIAALSAHGVSMTKRVLWAALETPALDTAIDLENRNQLLVRMTTGNLDEAIRARREGRRPVFED